MVRIIFKGVFQRSLICPLDSVARFLFDIFGDKEHNECAQRSTASFSMRRATKN